MKRVLLVTALAGGIAVAAVPAQAAPQLGGKCDGKVDVMCQENPCAPDYPCTIVICPVWVGTKCGL